MAVGAGLQLGGLKAAPGLAAALLALRHAVLPAVAIGLTAALALPPEQRAIVVLFAALPTASSAYVLAARMGGDGASSPARHGVDAARHGQHPALAGGLARCAAVPLGPAWRRQAPPRRLRQRPVDVLAHQRARGIAARARSAVGDARAIAGRARSALPSATARLRCQRSWPMRRIALPSVRAQELGLAPVPQLQQRRLGRTASRTSKSGSGLRCAYLFHGHTSWQSSQP